MNRSCAILKSPIFSGFLYSRADGGIAFAFGMRLMGEAGQRRDEI
jgi:hypothetical protein